MVPSKYGRLLTRSDQHSFINGLASFNMNSQRSGIGYSSTMHMAHRERRRTTFGHFGLRKGLTSRGRDKLVFLQKGKGYHISMFYYGERLWPVELEFNDVVHGQSITWMGWRGVEKEALEFRTLGGVFF